MNSKAIPTFWRALTVAAVLQMAIPTWANDQLQNCEQHLGTFSSPSLNSPVDLFVRMVDVYLRKGANNRKIKFEQILNSSVPINPARPTSSSEDVQFAKAFDGFISSLKSDDWVRVQELIKQLNKDNSLVQKEEDSQRLKTQALLSPFVFASGVVESSNVFASQYVRIGDRQFIVSESRSHFYVSEYDVKQNRYVLLNHKLIFGGDLARPLAISGSPNGKITIAANLSNTKTLAIEFDIHTKEFTEPIERTQYWNIHTPRILKIGNGQPLIMQLTPGVLEILAPDFENKTFQVHDSSPVSKLFGFNGLLSHQLLDVRHEQREPAVLKWLGDYYIAVERYKDIALYRLSGGTGKLSLLGKVRVHDKSFTAPNLFIADGYLHLMASTPKFEIFRWDEWFEGKGRFTKTATHEAKDRLSGNNQLIFDQTGKLEALGYMRHERPCVWFMKEDKEICPKSTAGKGHMKRNPTYFRYTDGRLIMVDYYYDEARFYAMSPNGEEYLTSIPQSVYFAELIRDESGLPFIYGNAYRDHFIIELFRNVKSRHE